MLLHLFTFVYLGFSFVFCGKANNVSPFGRHIGFHREKEKKNAHDFSLNRNISIYSRLILHNSRNVPITLTEISEELINAKSPFLEAERSVQSKLKSYGYKYRVIVIYLFQTILTNGKTY